MIALESMGRCSFMTLVLISGSPFSVFSAPCTLCEDRSAPLLPDLLVVIPPLVPATCSSLDNALPLVLPDETDDLCVAARRLSSKCGCPRRSDACNLCPNGSPVVNKNLEMPEFPPVIDDTLFTCDLLEAYMHSFSESDDSCSNAQRKAAQKCGCPDLPNDLINSSIHDNLNSTVDAFSGEDANSPVLTGHSVLFFTFLGAESSADLERLYVILRSAAALSVLGALLVIQDTLRSKRRRKCLYNRIVATMSVFDIVYTIAVALINIPSTTSDVLRSPEERGNYATCKAQGWFIQWGGMTSLFLNVSLSTYYILVIVYNRRETRLKAAVKWLIGIPLVAGLVVACASIPFISKSIQGCHIRPPSSTVVQQLDIEGNTASWGPYLGLYIVPAYVVIIYTTGALLRVYLHVRKVNRNANKWRFPTLSKTDAVQNGPPSDTTATASHGRRRTASSNLQKELAIQSAMYLVALYLSWFVYLVIALCFDRVLMSHYSLWAFVYFLIPLQGFLNSITYFRPRLGRLWVSYRKERLRRKKRQESSDGNGGSKSDDSTGMGGWAASEPAADMEELQEGTATIPFQNRLESSMDEDVECRRVSSSISGEEGPQRESTSSFPASAAQPLDAHPVEIE